jgi:hypothetical protein
VRLLRALSGGGCSPDRLEAIVVIDGVVDDTATALAGEPLPFPLRVLTQDPARGAAAARNLGARSARGALLLFLDDDIEPLPGSLAEHLRKHVESEEPSVVVGAPIPVRGSASDFHTLAIWGWWEQQFERLERDGHRMRYDDVYSGVLSIPTSLFASLGGFDADLPSSCRDDSELGWRLIERGARIVFSRSAGGLHHEGRDRGRLLERKIAEGQADVMLARLHPRLCASLRIAQPAPPIFSPIGLARRAAFRAPWLGDVVVWVVSRMLDLAESVRARSPWRSLNAALMYFQYWRGAALALGSEGAVRTLGERAAEASSNAPAISVDVGDGVVEAMALVDRERPAAIHVRYRGLLLGTIGAEAGAERLRGAHLRSFVSDRLGEPLVAAAALVELESA